MTTAAREWQSLTARSGRCRRQISTSRCPTTSTSATTISRNLPWTPKGACGCSVAIAQFASATCPARLRCTALAGKSGAPRWTAGAGSGRSSSPSAPVVRTCAGALRRTAGAICLRRGRWTIATSRPSCTSTKTSTPPNCRSSSGRRLLQCSGLAPSRGCSSTTWRQPSRRTCHACAGMRSLAKARPTRSTAATHTATPSSPWTATTTARCCRPTATRLMSHRSTTCWQASTMGRAARTTNTSTGCCSRPWMSFLTPVHSSRSTATRGPSATRPVIAISCSLNAVTRPCRCCRRRLTANRGRAGCTTT